MAWRLLALADGRSTEVDLTTGSFELGRRLLGPEFPFVSRCQATLHAIPEEPLRVLLRSAGAKNPTGIRPMGTTQWTWLKQGEQRTLSSGDAIALDAKLKTGTVFSLLLPAAAPVEGLLPAPQVQMVEVQPPPAPAPSTQTSTQGSSSSTPGRPMDPPRARWYWMAGTAWNLFDPAVEARLEAALSEGRVRVDVDHVRHVDLTLMRQVRNDDAKRYRSVRRVMPETPGAPAAPCTAASTEVVTHEPEAKRIKLSSQESADDDNGAAAGGGGARASQSLDSPLAVPSTTNAAASSSASDPHATPSRSVLPSPPAVPPVAAASHVLPAAPPNQPDAPPINLTPQETPTPVDVLWSNAYDAILYRRAREPPRTKVAALDLDGTLLRWVVPGWPQKLNDYALWSASVPLLIRQLHSNGYKIVIFGNCATIKGAFKGKTAEKRFHLTNWLEETFQVPLFALYATRKAPHPGGRYFKPEPGMWEAMEELLNQGVKVCPSTSFFVGDMAGREGDEGVSDKQWAANVGAARGVTMQFKTPEEAFGAPASGGGRGGGGGLGGGAGGTGGSARPPEASLLARAALMGGYLPGPRLVILCGPQGAGKSFFCSGLCGGIGAAEHRVAPQPSTSAPVAPKVDADGVHVLSSSSDESGDDEADVARQAHHPPPTTAASTSGSRAAGGGGVTWTVICQDTIGKDGKPGARTQCETAVRAALACGECVVVDRMHLSAEQREHFVKIGKEVGVPTDAVMLLPPLAVCQQRVRERRDHPGGVQGEQGAKMVAQSLQRLALPEHAEGFELITRMETGEEAEALACSYRLGVVLGSGHSGESGTGVVPAPPTRSFALRGAARPLPSLALGTMKLKGDRLADMLRNGGFEAVDTSTGYENEGAVGASLAPSAYLIVKVPRGGVESAGDVRTKLTASLGRLRRERCQLLLLHWPDLLIEAGKLHEVWGAMEAAVTDGLAEALGVCNFTVAALQHLLALRPAIPPAVNQVERHPLLPQWGLVDFCACHRIRLQAHTPLGQGQAQLLDHPVLRRASHATGLTPAQICIQWNLCHGVAVAPKCSSAQHAQELHDAARGVGAGHGSGSGALTPSVMKWLDAMAPPGQAGKRWIRPNFMTQPAPQRALYGF